jgi:hypothetical protein
MPGKGLDQGAPAYRQGLFRKKIVVLTARFRE